MVYRVTYMPDENFEMTLFRSMVERDCWDYIRRRLAKENCPLEVEDLFVVNHCGEFCELPADLFAVKEYRRAS